MWWHTALNLGPHFDWSQTHPFGQAEGTNQKGNTEMPSIQQTVSDSLRREGLSQYEGQATGVVRALEQRETRIKEGLRRAARDRGLRDQQITDLFRQVGLEQQPVTGGGQAATAGSRAVAPAGELFDRLVEFARQHGFRG